MIFVDLRSPKPLYEQIKDSIRTQVLHGLLLPDEKLPSVREMAQSNAINPNTIQRAYRDLEAEGILYSLPGRGSFVADAAESLKARRKAEILTAMSGLLAELRQLGMTNEEIVNSLEGGALHDD